MSTYSSIHLPVEGLALSALSHVFQANGVLYVGLYLQRSERRLVLPMHVGSPDAQAPITWRSWSTSRHRWCQCSHSHATASAGPTYCEQLGGRDSTTRSAPLRPSMALRGGGRFRDSCCTRGRLVPSGAKALPLRHLLSALLLPRLLLLARSSLFATSIMQATRAASPHK